MLGAKSPEPETEIKWWLLYKDFQNDDVEVEVVIQMWLLDDGGYYNIMIVWV